MTTSNYLQPWAEPNHVFESDDEDGNLENAVVEQQRLDEEDEDDESNSLGQDDNKL